jgi:hypothetical protein
MEFKGWTRQIMKIFFLIFIIIKLNKKKPTTLSEKCPILTGSSKTWDEIDTQSTQKVTGKFVSLTQDFPLCEMMRSYRWFPLMSKILGIENSFGSNVVVQKVESQFENHTHNTCTHEWKSPVWPHHFTKREVLGQWNKFPRHFLSGLGINFVSGFRASG